MNRASLHTHISPLHTPLFSRVQNQLHLSLQHNAIIQTNRPMHGTRSPRRHVDVSEHCSTRNYDTGQVREVVGIRLEVFVGAEINGILICSVAERKLSV